jgi:hypothetical protein
MEVTSPPVAIDLRRVHVEGPADEEALDLGLYPIITFENTATEYDRKPGI